VPLTSPWLCVWDALKFLGFLRLLFFDLAQGRKRVTSDKLQKGIFFGADCTDFFRFTSTLSLPRLSNMGRTGKSTFHCCFIAGSFARYIWRFRVQRKKRFELFCPLTQVARVRGDTERFQVCFVDFVCLVYLVCEPARRARKVECGKCHVRRKLYLSCLFQGGVNN